MSIILAIDQGTSGTKAIVVDDSGSTLSVAEEPLRPQYLDGGRVEQDPQQLLDSVLVAGSRAVAAAGRPIDGVALANQGESVLAWDQFTGTPLTPIVVWQDRRAQSICTALAEHSDRVAAKTGLVLDPYFSAPKMAWLRQNLTAEGVVTSTDSWLIHHLTGELVTDVSTASRSLLTSLDTTEFDPELLELFGLGRETLPRIVANDESVGTTRAFGSEVPVGGLIVDQQAALFAHRCLEAGMAKCTFGTGAFLLANVGDRPVRSRSGLTTSVAWRVRGQTPYCVDGQVYTAASAVRWIQDLGLIGSAAELDRVAATHSGGALCVPALAGLAAPWWRSDATASFSGMTLSTGRSELVLAVLQGIAAQIAELVDAVQQDMSQPLHRLRVDGGLTRSRVLLQAVANLLQIPVDVHRSAHATAEGAAALGQLALNPSHTIEETVPPSGMGGTYEPVWSSDQTSEFRSRWRAAALATIPPENAS